MYRSVRRHVTYANVVATAALFLALAGTSYAALQITSASIADRTINARDVKLNSLTGAEINEARLGVVPRAARSTVATSAASADRATTATSATTAASAAIATRATTADTATSAGTATTAGDSALLGGQAASAFAPASQFLTGAAPSGTAGAVILTWPEVGMRLVVGDGAADDQFNLALEATTATYKFGIQGVAAPESGAPAAFSGATSQPDSVLQFPVSTATSYVQFTILRPMSLTDDRLLEGTCTLRPLVAGFSGRIVCTARTTRA